MNNETIKIGLVKEWGSPRSNIQLFVPQEYCGTCSIGWTLITSYPGWSASEFYTYIDLNDNGSYQVGERFTPSTGQSTYALGISDGLRRNVDIYYFTMSGGTQNNHALSSNQEYANHTYNKNLYILKTIASNIDVTIIDNKAYYLPANANHS